MLARCGGNVAAAVNRHFDGGTGGQYRCDSFHVQRSLVRWIKKACLCAAGDIAHLHCAASFTGLAALSFLAMSPSCPIMMLQYLQRLQLRRGSSHRSLAHWLDPHRRPHPASAKHRPRQVALGRPASAAAAAAPGRKEVAGSRRRSSSRWTAASPASGGSLISADFMLHAVANSA